MRRPGCWWRTAPARCSRASSRTARSSALQGRWRPSTCTSRSRGERRGGGGRPRLPAPLPPPPGCAIGIPHALPCDSSRGSLLGVCAFLTPTYRPPLCGASPEPGVASLDPHPIRTPAGRACACACTPRYLKAVTKAKRKEEKVLALDDEERASQVCGLCVCGCGCGLGHGVLPGGRGRLPWETGCTRVCAYVCGRRMPTYNGLVLAGGNGRRRGARSVQ